MPTLGYNAQTYRDWFLYLLENRPGSVSSKRWPDAQVLTFFREAERLFQERLAFKNTVSASVSLSTSNAHQLPSGIQGRKIKEILFRKTGNADFTRMTQRRYSDAVDAGMLSSSATASTPASWFVDPSDTSAFYVYPKSDTAGTLLIHYVTQVSPLRRIWKPASITAGVTNGSATVTLSAAATAGWLAAGDEFGVIDLTQKDETTTSNIGPTTWYKTSTVDGTAVTLAETYEGPTDTAALFITAQVSDMEAAYPAKLGYAIPTYAVGMALQVSAPQQGMALKGEAMAMVAGLSVDDGAIYNVFQSLNETPFQV